MATILTRAAIDQAAAKAGIEAAALRTVVRVETGGLGGFLPNGWVRILFERHWLWRRLEMAGRDIDPHDLAQQRPDLCGRKWEPKHYLGGVKEWDRVMGVTTWAQRNDDNRWESYKKATYESCSWGLFQIMGFHYQLLGYANVYDFKHAQEEGEETQLADALKWLDSKKLLTVLQRHDWETFALRYNGEGQVAKYTKLLKKAYAIEKNR